MGRSLRVNLPNIPFHIIIRGNNRQAVFKEDKDFIYFLKLIKRYKKEFNFKLYHLCLMPNHVHFMLEPTIEGSLSKIMLRLSLAYTFFFNNKYGNVGHLWQGRFKSSLIDKEDYFIWCGIYNELNPVRARLVKTPEEWPCSSFRFYAFDEKDDIVGQLIDSDPYYLALSPIQKERESIYKETIEGVMKEEFLKNIRKSIDEGIFGTEEFAKKMKREFNIKSLSPRGRPRRQDSQGQDEENESMKVIWEK